MRKQKAFLPIFVLVLVLIQTASNRIILPIGQAASENITPHIYANGEYEIYLPLVNKNSWSSACYAPGTENYQVPDPEIPDIVLQHGTTITVTTSADIINGNVSGVPELIANPGPDGIALREAIEATNVDPGEYTINFSPTLNGSTIYTGAENNADLPPLLGGSLIINGDIDGDGLPDIKIADATSFDFPFGFQIYSSGNTLHALELQGYFVGVAIEPIMANTIYEDITVSNMVIKNSLNGIKLYTGRDWASNYTWDNILLLNNDLSVQIAGIAFELAYSSGVQINNLTISSNSINIDNQGDRDSLGIQLMAGFWDGSDNNVITNATIADNTVQGNPAVAIGIMSGTIGAKFNVIDGMTVLNNDILISEVIPEYTIGFQGIFVVTGDGSTEYVDPDYKPVAYPENNTLKNVNIIANHIEGFGTRGIDVAAGNWGSRHNTIENLSILNNQLHTFIPDIEPEVSAINIQSGSGWPAHHTTDNLIKHIIVQNNYVYMSRQEGLPDFGYDSDGAVRVIGGSSPGADRNQVQDFWITLNEVDSVIAGIHLLGGNIEDNENVINYGNVRCNTIVRNPLYPQRDPPLKGLLLTGGAGDCTLNRVENINLYYNDVAGIWNDRTVNPNLHDTAINNVVDYTATP